MTMPAGRYYVGDLCYVMTYGEWEDVCDVTCGPNGYEVLNGEFDLSDGRRFATYSTMYGDGGYQCSDGAILGVDSGMIGCILVDDIRAPSGQTEVELRGYGTVIDFEKPFETGSDGNGLIRFGDVTIETGDMEGDE